MHGKEFRYKVLKVNGKVQGNIKYDIIIIERDNSFGFDLKPGDKLQLEYNTNKATTSFNDKINDITDITFVSHNNEENKKKFTNWGFNNGLQPNKGSPNKGSPNNSSKGGKKKKVVKKKKVGVYRTPTGRYYRRFQNGNVKRISREVYKKLK